MKNILASKTFWLNVVGAAQLYTNAIPMDPLTSAYALIGLNIANRFLTKGAVSLLPQGK